MAGSYDDDDDDDDLDLDDGDVGDGSEDEEEKDEDEHIQRVEAGFGSDRARIQSCGDLDELRGLRAEYQRLETRGGLSMAGRIRAHDLVELIDDRITDIKARRMDRRWR